MATRALKTVEHTLDEIDTAHSTLHGSMALAFAEIDAAIKSADNPFFKSKYADLGAIIGTVKPALVSHGLFFTQHCHPSEDGVIVETVLHHRGGESLSMGQLYVPANKRDPQGFGSAQTYARRYALQTAFGVPTEDDDGVAAATSNHPSQGATPPAKSVDKDAPFPAGPCKNKTALKDAGRELWADVMACEDSSALDALLISQKDLIDQLKAALPNWWNGGTRAVDGGGSEPYEGLGQVIERLQLDFAAINEVGMDFRGDVRPRENA
jgi:hypothetical protein